MPVVWLLRCANRTSNLKTALTRKYRKFMSFVYYRKHELIKLCELAQELDLEKITSTNDYELSQVNRRPITENGVTQAVCEIGQVPIWSSPEV
jgi:hypothetical protein